MISALLLGFCTLSGCAEKNIAQSEPELSPASETTQNIGPHAGERPLTFYSAEELEAARAFIPQLKSGCWRSKRTGRRRV